MVIDLKDAVPFLTWFPYALRDWVLVVSLIALIATLVGWLVSAFRHGPIRAFAITGKAWYVGVGDLLSISPRRVMALSRLTIKESIRHRVAVVVVFAIFTLILLYAGWFLDPKSINPALLYLDFVLSATSFLVLVTVLFLSTLSLPADIKNRTLYTVVTKPVRMSEIVLGRLFGITAIGVFLLVVMGLISYVFVYRNLSHTHALVTENLSAAEGSIPDQPPTLTGRTSYSNNHSHIVTISPEGKSRMEPEQGHWHSITIEQEGDKTVYNVGPEEGMMMARVPIYGKLTFRDRGGQPAEKGISVGKEWTYRSYFEGGTLAAAVWTFQGVTPEAFPDGLPIELNISIYRTYTGEITKGVPGSLSLRNPKTGKMVEALIFSAKDFVVDTHVIDREITSSKGEKLDLFKDLTDNGTVEIWLRCIAPAQYFGAAQADLHLRAPDGYYTLNFIKGYAGIGLQMMLLIGLGVLFSTFLSGPVAFLATAGMLVGGMFYEHLYAVAFQQTVSGGEVFGGGPFESMLRIVTQENIVTDLDPSLRAMVVQTLDRLAEPLMQVAALLLPDFRRFSFTDYVANGYDIPLGQLLKFTCRTLAFIVPTFVAGLFCLKTREIAQ
jgi:hypothetical protein